MNSFKNLGAQLGIPIDGFEAFLIDGNYLSLDFFDVKITLKMMGLRHHLRKLMSSAEPMSSTPLYIKDNGIRNLEKIGRSLTTNGRGIWD